MAILTSDKEAKPDTLRIHITPAYMEGREAFAQGKGFEANPYGDDRYTAHLDWAIGHADAHDLVSIEFRAEAEQNGENR